jgi:hypothetical protein
VVDAEPIIREPDDRRDADASERRDDEAVSRADGECRAVPPVR